jgi:hypothetical protein
MSPTNPFENLSDSQVVTEAFTRQGTVGGPLAEMMRRLKGAVEAQEVSSTRLGERIERLNWWLLGVTIAIGALTLAQVLVAVLSRR